MVKVTPTYAQKSVKNFVNLNVERNNRASSSRGTMDRAVMSRARKFLQQYLRECAQMNKVPFEDENYAKRIGHISVMGRSSVRCDEEMFDQETQTGSAKGSPSYWREESASMDTVVSDHCDGEIFDQKTGTGFKDSSSDEGEGSTSLEILLKKLEKELDEFREDFINSIRQKTNGMATSCATTEK